jgi:endonuclease G, mitochondrial
MLFASYWFCNPLLPRNLITYQNPKKGVLVKHQYYALSYIHKYKDAEWVAYRLTNTMVIGPAEDMSFSQDATDKTYYMSNMTLQMGSFNRGVWKKLEIKVREWVKKYKELYVVSGAALKND